MCTSLASGQHLVGVVHGYEHIARTVHPRHPLRGVLTHLLLEGLGVTDDECTIEPDQSDIKEAVHEIHSYHHEEYLKLAQQATTPFIGRKRKRGDDDVTSDSHSSHSSSTSQQLSALLERPAPQYLVCGGESERGKRREEKYGFGSGSDCARFEDMYRYMTQVAAGSVSAATYVQSGDVLRSVHWEGGRHHAKPSRAAGLCYVADVVLATQELLNTFKKILVIDLDVHHGDGTQQAFYCSDRVFTLSFHMHGQGIFPQNSGGMNERGAQKGLGYNMNVPLRPGCTDALYYHIVHRVSEAVKSVFKPDAIVVICGADVLYGDELGELCVSMPCMFQCISTLRDWNLPSVFLGGGGYNNELTARYWTCLTALLKVFNAKPPPEDADYDPFDLSTDILPSSIVRRMGLAALEASGLPESIPADSLGEVYELFTPSNLVVCVPPLVATEDDPNFEDIKLMMHLSLNAVLSLQRREGWVEN